MTTKYLVTERLRSPDHPDGGSVFQAETVTGKRWLFPAFDTLRDLHIFMRHTTKDYTPGIVGNVNIKYLELEPNR